MRIGYIVMRQNDGLVLLNIRAAETINSGEQQETMHCYGARRLVAMFPLSMLLDTKTRMGPGSAFVGFESFPVVLSVRRMVGSLYLFCKKAVSSPAELSWSKACRRTGVAGSCLE